MVKELKTTRRASTIASGDRHKEPKRGARPSSQFRLTLKERAILADPDWVTENEADIIYCMRHEHEPTTSLEMVVKQLGLPAARADRDPSEARRRRNSTSATLSPIASPHLMPQ